MIFCVLFSFFLGGQGIENAQIVQAQAGINLALNQPTYASSSRSGHIASHAVDGSLSTYWSSAYSEPQWIYVDLGASYAISQVILKWENAYGRNYRVDGSADATTWTQLVEVTNQNGGSDYIEVVGTWRYIRIYCVLRGTGWGFGLLEFEVYDIAQPVTVEYPIPPSPPPRSTGDVLFVDDFNDTNIDDWQVLSGDWQATTGAVGVTVPCNTGPYQIINGDENWGDFQISLDFMRTSGWDYGGIILRYSDNGYYRVDINPSTPYGGWVKLYKSPNTELALRSWPFIHNHWNRFIIDVEGPTIEVYALDASQNPELLLSYTDPDPILMGKIGFAAIAGAAECPVQVRYDNVSVKAIIPSFTVSGEIHDLAGSPIPEVTLHLSGSDLTTFTYPNGNYTIYRIPAGLYNITPSKPGYNFAPRTQSLAIGPNASSVDFTGEFANWTLMYYLAGDDPSLNDSYNVILNQLERAAGNNSVNIVVIWDTLGSAGTRYYHVQPDTNLNSLANYIESQNTWDMGELNMGDPSTLVNFVNWAKQNYPANYYSLILDDHGNGLGGAMSDSTSDDILSLNEISNALENVTSGWQKIDVLVMNACLMGMLEDAYQFRNFTNYYVASENIQWAYNRGYYDTAINVTSTTTPLEMGNLYVQKYADEAIPMTVGYTMSVADMSQIDNLVQTINVMAGLISADMDGNTDELNTVLSQVQRFDNNFPTGIINDQDQYIDLFDFARLIQDQFQDPAIRQSAQAVMDAVIAYAPPSYGRHATGQGVDNSHGVSIFFPTNRSSFYNVDNYSFAVGAIWIPGQQSHKAQISEDPPTVLWGPFLVEYINITNPDGEDNSTPPPLIPKPIIQTIHLPIIIK